MLTSGRLERKKFRSHSEEANSSQDEEASHVSTILAEAVVDETLHVRSAKTMKTTAGPAFTAATDDLLDGGLNGLKGKAEHADAKTDVAVVFLESGSHLEGTTEGDDHVRVDEERVCMRKEVVDEVGPSSDARPVGLPGLHDGSASCAEGSLPGQEAGEAPLGRIDEMGGFPSHTGGHELEALGRRARPFCHVLKVDFWKPRRAKMFTVRMEEAILEGREEERCLVDVLGLLEDVSHGDAEAICADGAPSH